MTFEELMFILVLVAVILILAVLLNVFDEGEPKE